MHKRELMIEDETAADATAEGDALLDGDDTEGAGEHDCGRINVVSVSISSSTSSTGGGSSVMNTSISVCGTVCDKHVSKRQPMICISRRWSMHTDTSTGTSGDTCITMCVSAREARCD
jgi:hypothetical protein